MNKLYAVKLKKIHPKLARPDVVELIYQKGIGPVEIHST